MQHWIQQKLAPCIDFFLSAFTSLVTGVYSKPAHELHFSNEGKVYYANHNSHGDFLMVWVSLPKYWRMNARPVAAADYWLKSPVRRFIITKVFNGFLVDRTDNNAKELTEKMHETLAGGSSLIIFPEGTRNQDEQCQLQDFKSGIYHLAELDPERTFIPVWINNMNFVLPKGHFLPVPLLCGVHIGAPLQLHADESKADFLARSHRALKSLAPDNTKENA